MATICFNNSSIWFYPRFLSYLVLGSWSPKECWVPHEVDLKSNQTLTGYFLKLYATITLTNLAGRTPL